MSENIAVLKDRLKSAHHAFITSKTEEELKTFRELVKYLENKIRDKIIGDLPEEELD